jgi:phage antirepressor YoqD-like protein
MPFTGWSSEVTPRDIAPVLGISEKALRAWLRKNSPVIHAHRDRWVVTPDDADRIVEAYRGSQRQ